MPYVSARLRTGIDCIRQLQLMKDLRLMKDLCFRSEYLWHENMVDENDAVRT